MPTGPPSTQTPSGGISMETLPSVGPRLDSAALDESIYSAQSFAKPSPFHAVGTADEHFEGAEAASRDWGSPLSEPGSPRGTFAAKAEANSAIAGGGGSGIVQAKVCIYIPRWPSILAMIGDSTIVLFFVCCLIAAAVSSFDPLHKHSINWWFYI